MGPLGTGASTGEVWTHQGVLLLTLRRSEERTEERSEERIDIKHSLTDHRKRTWDVCGELLCVSGVCV